MDIELWRNGVNRSQCEEVLHNTRQCFHYDPSVFYITVHIRNVMKQSAGEPSERIPL